MLAAEVVEMPEQLEGSFADRAQVALLHAQLVQVVGNGLRTDLGRQILEVLLNGRLLA